MYDDSGENYVPTQQQSISINPALSASSYTPNNYNTANGETQWSATVDGNVISGDALCSTITASNADIAPVGFTPNESGTGCWCRVTNIGGDSNRWVYATTVVENETRTCLGKCGYYCANNMNGVKAKNIAYRTSLYTASGIRPE